MRSSVLFPLTLALPMNLRLGQASRPTPLAFERHYPAGMNENSPAFQRWDRCQGVLSPEGTAEPAAVRRPFGTYPGGRAHPALKRWATFVCPSGTGAESHLSDAGYSSNPIGIGRLACLP